MFQIIKPIEKLRPGGVLQDSHSGKPIKIYRKTSETDAILDKVISHDWWFQVH